MILCFFLDAVGLFEVSLGIWYTRHSRACLSNGFSSSCSTHDTMTTKVTEPLTGQHIMVIWIMRATSGLGIIVYGLLCTSACKGQMRCCYKGIVALACPAVWTVS